MKKWELLSDEQRESLCSLNQVLKCVKHAIKTRMGLWELRDQIERFEVDRSIFANDDIKENLQAARELEAAITEFYLRNHSYLITLLNADEIYFLDVDVWKGAFYDEIDPPSSLD